MKLVLFVEDDEGIFRPYQLLLQRYFEVQVVTTLEACFAFLCSSKPDLVLLDLNLSDCKGIETLDRLIGLRPEIPVVVFTGSQELADQAIHRGAQDYIVKDGQYTPKRMAEIIGKAIVRHEVRQDFRPIKGKILALQQKLEDLGNLRPPS